MLNPDTRLSPTSPAGLHRRDLGDEYLFYEESGEQVHVLNGTAREIYLLCDGGRTMAEVARAFRERYEIDLETAEGAVDRTVRRLVDLGLLGTS